MCRTCGDKGIVRANWADATEDFALCLCPAGMEMRRTDNAGRETGFAQWQIWCERYQVNPARVYLLEEILTAEELAERGFGQTPEAIGREAALLALGTRKVKL